MCIRRRIMTRFIRKFACQISALVAVFMFLVHIFDPLSLRTTTDRHESQHSTAFACHQGWKTFRKSLERYRQSVHAEGVAALRSPAGSASSNARTLIWSCVRETCNCGMGDQILKIQFAFLLALMSDRVFVLHWEDGLRQRTGGILPNKINWDVFNSSAGMCSGVSHDRPCARRVYKNRSLFGYGWTEREFEQFGEVLFGPERHVTILANAYLNALIFVGEASMMRAGKLIEGGFEHLGVRVILDRDRFDGVFFTHGSPWYRMLELVGLRRALGILPMNNGHVLASESWVQLNHAIFHYLFKFPAKITARVSEMKKSLGLDVRPYFAVHLRTGFKNSPYINDSPGTRWTFWDWKFFDQVNWPCILSRSIEMSERLLGYNSSVYLATDSVSAKEWAMTTYGTRIRTATLNPTHFAHGSSGFTDDTSLWVDFLMLGDAQFLMHSDSSFATTAAFLRPIPLSQQAWIWVDKSTSCLVSRLESNTSCICLRP